MSNSLYSLRKSRRILRESFALFKRKEKKISLEQKKSLETDLRQLDQLLLAQDRRGASELAKQVEQKTKTILPKNFFDFSIELGAALVFALVVATLVRTMWFELYEIPTGSMRPTFKEQDRLVVSKTDFGINVPFIPKHLLFDPKLVQRTGIFIFSVENMDVSDPDTNYFYLFPGKKLLIKRCIGKPGDTLYFYGGLIYGIDKEGQDLVELRSAPWLQKIDHVPFITFEGKTHAKPPLTATSPYQFELYQMNQPVAKLLLQPTGQIKGLIFNGQNWESDRPEKANKPHDTIVTYSDLWGMNNYAMARLLTKNQAQEFGLLSNVKDEGTLYLELSHTPNLIYPEPRFATEFSGQLRPLLTPSQSVLPLTQEHLNALMDGLYTARFVVKGGYASRYLLGDNTNQPNLQGAPLPGIPDGTYEFYYGKAYSVGWGGITTLLPPNHPLYRRDIKTIQTLFNLGIEFSNYFSPHSKLPFAYPTRYAYFRKGDLFVMGHPVVKKGDPILEAFLLSERKRAERSTSKQPYIAFEDRGPPVKEGKIDIEFIRHFGIQVPDKMYLVLGDNYAMSADSRDFGFVPEDNIRGAPSFIFWPPGSRWGPPAQQGYPWFVEPQLIIWGAVAAISLLSIWYYRRKSQKPIFPL